MFWLANLLKMNFILAFITFLQSRVAVMYYKKEQVLLQIEETFLCYKPV